MVCPNQTVLRAVRILICVFGGLVDLKVRVSKRILARSTVWFGQTMASISWIASVLIYDLNSAGDWLQLLAASSWLLANLSGLAIKNE